MASWRDQLSDIVATCFSPSADLLDVLDAENLTASMAAFPTNNTISDDHPWFDESLELPIEASLAMLNDVTTF